MFEHIWRDELAALSSVHERHKRQIEYLGAQRLKVVAGRFKAAMARKLEEYARRSEALARFVVCLPSQSLAVVLPGESVDASPEKRGPPLQR